MKKQFTGALILIALAACSGADPRCANLPGGGRYCLQTTSVVEPFEVQQIVEVIFDGRRETMLVELEVDGQGMRFVGMTPFGQKLVQGAYDNLEAKTDGLLSQSFEPTMLLSFLQLALWPADSVRAGLEGGCVLEESVGQRRVMGGGNMLLQVSYTGRRLPHGEMHIELPSAKMQIDIKTLDLNITK